MKRLSFFLSLFLILGLLWGVLEGRATGLNNIGNINDDLQQLEAEEKSILEELFLLTQEVKELQRQELELSLEITRLEDLIEGLDLSIIQKQHDYDEGLRIMEEVLRSYQKRGPISYLQLILSSENINTLLGRINGLRDISKGTSELLDKLELEKLALTREKERLDENASILLERKLDLSLSLEQKEESVLELETRLESLQDERSKYEGYLAQLEGSMEEIKPIFAETIERLSNDIENGNLSEDLLSLQIGFAGIKGTIEDKKLNEEFKEKPYPTEVIIRFHDNSMVLELPELHLIMNGNLELLNENTLGFRMATGEYMGFTLERAAMEDLFVNGLLELRFSALLGKNTIRSVQLFDGYMELSIKTSLF